MARKYKQGLYKPKHPEKYRGDPTKIMMRSSWETKFSMWVDNNPAVIEWGSETIIIPYVSPIDNRGHRYYVDFWIKVQNSKKQIETYIVEIKPKAQCYPPDYSHRKRLPKAQVIMEEQCTYAVNQTKWKAARQYAKQRGWKFIVLTEDELNV
jgi:head completion protein